MTTRRDVLMGLVRVPITAAVPALLVGGRAVLARSDNPDVADVGLTAIKARLDGQAWWQEC